ncbi:hypothetical protein [Streptomyces noursei]|uniref:hypothetical protein n=1 Tax=Streptomyces noursei TaxID=1971 RepID=UPI0023B7DBE5|nr:hypothetical protein [Streptomyces noursei]
MTAVLPDADELVRAALAAWLAEQSIPATVWALWPDDWHSRMPLIVTRRIPGGGAPDPRGVDLATMTLTACAGTRTAAHLLARQARSALFDQCQRQFATSDGYLSSFGEDSAPAEDRSPGPVLHTDAFRFSATYRVITRPLAG